ncbi:hypothetical protein SETIT_6G058600v2 [Setaria italica]|uniref:Uncharacterized protein n=2 Tax=Setaria TaxID=4554 RepID=A0A368RIG0_SETIT|nr:hypothetical protein SETIT_6G058600v2 [Setaria italica]TKW08908.1 hypothetical protein SEVIR_6G056200v2 [Setaria viridis]
MHHVYEKPSGPDLSCCYQTTNPVERNEAQSEFVLCSLTSTLPRRTTRDSWRVNLN